MNAISWLIMKATAVFIMNLVNLKAFIIKAQHKNFGRF